MKKLIEEQKKTELDKQCDNDPPKVRAEQIEKKRSVFFDRVEEMLKKYKEELDKKCGNNPPKVLQKPAEVNYEEKQNSEEEQKKIVDKMDEK